MNIHYNLNGCLIVFLFITLSGISAQAVNLLPPNPAEPLSFEHITSREGLASERIQAIVQDQQGFIWIGTLNGLYRYDGYKLKLFEHNSDNPHSPAGNSIDSMYVDSTGYLWLGTTGSGLDRFDPLTEQFLHYPGTPDKRFISSVVAITEDGSGGLWFATQSDGLHRIDRDTGQIRSFLHNPSDPRSINSERLVSLLFDNSGQLWVGTDHGLDRYEPETGHFIHYFNNPDNPRNLLNRLIISMAEDGDGNLWLAVYGEGLHYFNPRTGELVRYVNDPTDPYSLGDNKTYEVYVDSTGTLWVGSFASGLHRYEPETGHFYRYQYNFFNPESLLKGPVKNIFEDRSGSLWLAVDGGGIAVWHPGKTAFSHYFSHPTPDFQPDSISEDSVRAIYQDRSGIIWIGTATDGLNRLDPATGEFTYYRHDRDDPHSLSSGGIYSIFESSNGVLWVGGFTGLNRFDRITGQVIRYHHDRDNPQSLSHDFVLSMTEDSSGILWIGTYAGLNRLDPATGQITAYLHNPADPDSISPGQVLSLYPADDGTLWISTAHSGLNHFNPLTGQFKHYRHDSADTNSLSNDNIAGIYKNESGFVWIATRAGLNRLDPSTGEIIRYGQQNGLAANSVMGILEDDQGYLWLSTSKGLSRFDPRTETFRNFEQSDGINNLEYDFFAYHRTGDGKLWFGGKKGIDIVDPNRLIKNLNVPPVVINTVLVNNEPVTIGDDSVLPRAITSGDILTLTFEDRVVTFEFAALNFVNPQKNQYKYMLEGFDKDWVQTTSDLPFATYTNLDPGDYVFQVIGSNNDGVWNETGASIRLTMIPMLWQTWWFYGLLALVAMAVLVIIYQAKVNQLNTEKAAAAAVRASEQQLRFVTHHAPVLIAHYDREQHYKFVNQPYADMIGLKIEEIIDKHASDVLDEEVYENARLHIETVLTGQVSEYDNQLSSNLETVHVKYVPEFDAYNTVIGYVAAITNITERKQAEEQLAAERERLAVTLHSIGDGVITTDIDGNVVLMNRVAEELTGWIQQEAKGRPLTTVFHIINEKTREPLENPFENVIAAGTLSFSRHIVLAARDDIEHLITDSSSPIYNTNHEIIGIVLVFRDVTEEYQKDRQLHQSQKMESIGQLAGGIAHDFNNVLNGILSASQLLKLEKQGLNEKSLKYVDMIIQASTRASDLIKKLLAFSRKGNVITSILDINEILHDVVAILEGTIDKKITISVSRDAPNHKINGDLSVIESIILNLGINASHAMPDGGVIQLTTKNISLDQKYCDSSTFDITPGEFLQIEVIDSGCGIEKENLQKIFEPFYTTKEQGKGTGLGLSAAYGAIQDHHGVIEVFSEVGSGTTFYILLPCSIEQNENKKEESPILTGSGTILLVDDEEFNRILNKEILESLGYKVLLAEDGKESIEVFSKKHSEIDIVLMDMIMPQMNGSEAFYIMKEIDDNCKVIFASGYIKDEIIEGLKQNGSAGFINKPYKISDLSQLLNDVMSK